MMKLDNRPLLGVDLDRDLFVDPPIMPRLQRAVDHRLNALVIGEAGSGKTSLLRRVAAQRDGTRQPLSPVYVDLAPAATAEQALMLVAEALGQRDAVQAWGDALTRGLVPPSTESSRLLRLARRLGDASPSLILADAPPGNGESHAIFGRLRDELWQLEHQWIVAANPTLRDELTRPPATAFFDVQLALDPLPAELQRELLRRRVAGEPRIDIDELVGKTDGLPRSVIALARETMLAGGSPTEALRRRKQMRERLQELPSAAQAITAYLATHGATSGSDPGLLGFLGVSGQRARQVLQELEAKGIVRSFAEQQERRGRPRKLYELVDEVR